MSLSVGMVTIDTTDVVRLSQWWAEHLGLHPAPGSHEGFTWLVGGPVGLGFQKVEHPTPGKNRIHLDLKADDMAAEVTRLTEAGATVIGERSIEGFTWTTLTDPDGNEFCLATYAP